MAVFETWLRSDLKKPLVVQKLTGNLFSADNEGNKIGVEVLDNGAAASLSGSVYGYVIRADGATVTVTGTLSNNKAYIVLPSSVYSVVGQVSIVIKVGTTTVGACVAYVYRTTTDAIVDPGHVIPSISELLEKIGACEAAAAAANKVANLTVSAEAATGSTPDAVLSETGSPAHKHITFKLVKGDTGAVPNLSVGTVTTGAAGTNVSVTRRSGSPDTAPVFDFTIPKGDKGDTGDAFHIVKTYASVSAMNADYSGTDTHVGDYVMIVSSVEDPDNAKVYIKGSSAWSFVVDMSGATGIQGQQAYVWIRYADAEPTQDSDMKTTPSSWIGIYSGTASSAPTTYSSYTWYEIKGAKGNTGNTGAAAHIYIRYAADEPTQDSDMKTTADAWIGVYAGTASSAPTTYTSYTWYKIKGDPGSISNAYGNTLEMSSTDSTKISEAIAGKISAPGTAGTSGQVLTSDGQGGQSWQTPSGGTVTDVQEDGTSILSSGVANILTMTGAGSGSAGTKGLVPAPASGDSGKFLKGDGTWDNVPDPQTMTGATASAAGTGGLVPAPSAGANVLFLRGDGTWDNPPGSKLIVVDLDTVTNASGSYTHSTTVNGITADMKAVMVELGNPDAFLDTINIVTSTNAITLTCSSVAGTSTVKASLLFIATANAITSSEFDVLAGRIGTLSSLATTAKTDLVAAVNEVAGKIASIVANGTDFNNMKTGGTYCIYTNLHQPSGSSTSDMWGLIVFVNSSGTVVKQIAVSMTNDSDATYQRRFSNNAWSAWSSLSENVQMRKIAGYTTPTNNQRVLTFQSNICTKITAYGDANSRYLELFVRSSSTGENVAVQEIVKGSNMSYTTSGATITITSTGGNWGIVEQRFSGTGSITIS